MSDDVGSVTSPRVLANLSIREVTYPPLPPNARPAPGRTTDDRKDTDTVMTIHVSLTFPVDQLIETADERLDARADSRRSVGRSGTSSLRGAKRSSYSVPASPTVRAQPLRLPSLTGLAGRSAEGPCRWRCTR